MSLLKAIIVILLLGATVAFASPAREETIKQLLDVTQSRKLVDGVRNQFDALMHNTVQQTLKGRIPTPSEQQAIDNMTGKMATVLQDELAWEKLEPMYIRHYEDVFSEEEVNGMLSFYRTPVGQAVVGKMPALMQKTVLDLQSMALGLSPKFLKIQQEFIAELKATNNDESTNRDKSLRIKRISGKAEEARFAEYLENWKHQIKRVSTMNFPEDSTGKLHGSLVLLIRIKSDGNVENVNLLRSSGIKNLDEAALRIVSSAAPYPAFSPEIRRDTDILEIVCPFSFTTERQLDTDFATQEQRPFAHPTDYVPIEKVQIADKFPTIALTQETLLQEMHRCVPKACSTQPCMSEGVSRFPSKSLGVFGHANLSNQFWVLGSTGMCLQTSSERFLILAAEAFYGTANPVGISSSIADSWYRQLALLMAKKGSVKVAYKMADGSAYVVNYWVDPGQSFSLFYSASKRELGSWEQEALDFQFSDPSMASVAINKKSPGDKYQKTNLLYHRSSL